jgi:tRNA (guanine37-N1)-methyltransferase
LIIELIVNSDYLVLCVKVQKEKAEAIKQFLIKNNFLDRAYRPKKEGDFVFFPVKEKINDFEIVEKELEKKESGKKLKNLLKEKLSDEELDSLISSFDIVGDIAVLEIPPNLIKKEQLIANVIFQVHKNVKTVAKKTGATSGVFRIRPVEVIAGKNTTLTIHRENNCLFMLDLNKCYFSPRLSTERTRISLQVKKNENILIPFAGVGPFAIRISKKEPTCSIVAIELNQEAINYFEKNLDLNKCKNIQIIQGDVAKILPNIYENWANRIVMPMPMGGKEFLKFIIPCLKRGGILHYYSFVKRENMKQNIEKEIKEEIEQFKRKYKILYFRKVRDYSKEIVQAVLDVQIF